MAAMHRMAAAARIARARPARGGGHAARIAALRRLLAQRVALLCCAAAEAGETGLEVEGSHTHAHPPDRVLAPTKQHPTAAAPHHRRLGPVPQMAAEVEGHKAPNPLVRNGSGDDDDDAAAAVLLEAEELRTALGAAGGDAVLRYARAEIARSEQQLQATVQESATEIYATFEVEKANWHQATTFYMLCGNSDESLRTTGYVLAAASFALVTMQMSACAVVFFGAVLQTCATNFQCLRPGTYCSGREMCDYCGEFHPGVLPVEFTADFHVINRGFDPDYKLLKGNGDEIEVGAKGWTGTYNVTTVANHCATSSTPADTNWCTHCYRPWMAHEADRVDATVFSEDITFHNVNGMSIFDRIVLFLASLVVAMAVTSELRDIFLCEVAVARAQSKCDVGKSTLWLLRVLSWLRRCCFLPALVSVVPWLVVVKGADALNVCFNTVAMLFLVEIDNSAYAFLLGERTRTKVERECRVRLTNLEAGALSQSKTIYSVAVVISVVGAIAYAGRSPGGRTGGGEGIAGPTIFLCFFCFGLGAFIDTVVLGDPAQRNAKSLALQTVRITVTSLLGLGWYAISAVVPMMEERQGVGNG
eukprot:COSAG01_NODE_5495_length_4226_cov_3.635328_2_plen_588_part_00